VIEGGRQADCPNCGGPIAFKLGTSSALVCPWCRFSVVRSDRDLEAIGKVADLVPTAPVMTVGDLGRVDGEPFTVGGRLQLDHGKGPWDEWYVAFRDGTWGWLAQGQGRWYLTKPVLATGLPGWEQMVPGHSGELPGGDITWTVTERGESVLLSAEGELPFRAVSGERGRYVDLEGPGGAFGTIDYGDGSEAPTFFVGRQLARDELTFEAGAAGPRPEEKVDVARLRCPNCGAPVPITQPGTTERAGCQSCGALLDYQQGNLALLKRLQKPDLVPLIPLGREGRLRDEALLCIGFMERCTVVEGITYAWREYLLHGDGGYRWLMEDNGNWTLLSPVSAGDVGGDGQKALFQGRKYKLFATNRVTVRYVVGEFYWKVEVGEESQATDLIAPPYLLSEERTPTEVIWSHGEWIAGKEIWEAFGLEGEAPKPTDVAPAQPNPVPVAYPVAVSAIFVVLLAVVAVAVAAARSSGPDATLVSGPVPMPSAPDPAYQKAAEPGRGLTAPSASGRALAGTDGRRSGTAGADPSGEKGGSQSPTFTESFTVPSDAKNLRVTMRSDLGHGWIGLAVALVSEAGQLIEFTVEEDAYYGSTGSPTTAMHRTTVYVGDVPPGAYTMRIDPRWARQPGSLGVGIPPTVELEVATDPGAPDVVCPCCCAGMLLLLPAFFAFARRTAFERRRWSLSNVH
jgi:hypothetical protein